MKIFVASKAAAETDPDTGDSAATCINLPQLCNAQNDPALVRWTEQSSA
jgi:hypothetical protein